MKDAGAVKAAIEKIKTTMVERLPESVWFAVAGTALAAYYGRNDLEGGVVLPGDNDIDIGVLAETCSVKEFSAAFDAAGFERGYFFRANDVGAVIRYFFDGVPFDCYWMYLRGTKHSRKRWFVTVGPTPHILPAYLFEDLHSVKFLNVDIPAPYPLDLYCAARLKRVGDRFPDPEGGGEYLDRISVDDWRIYSQK